jgi:hypothetical protein
MVRSLTLERYRRQAKKTKRSRVDAGNRVLIPCPESAPCDTRRPFANPLLEAKRFAAKADAYEWSDAGGGIGQDARTVLNN